MLALQAPMSTFWATFWDDLEQAECPWARKMSGVDQTNFEQTIESMLRASMPVKPMDRLRELWSSFPLDRPLSDDHPDVWWNLSCTLEGPDHTTDKEAKAVLDELWLSQEGMPPRSPTVRPETVDQALPFLKKLKYTALCSLWKFWCSWSCFTATLPLEVVNKLREELFRLTMLVLLRELK